MRQHRKRWRHPLLVATSVIFVLVVLSVTSSGLPRRLFNCPDKSSVYGGEVLPISATRHLLEHSANASQTTGSAQFPRDFFTQEQRRQGAVIFHIIGLIYMFVALAIVCDEFFIPSLDVITEKLDISEDVAGATFMAAGGSAPELFTSVIGVFISFDDVGIGTIVGSAVFNILFVLSMCAIFSKTVLQLTWWPLFRDVSFYSIILIVLILFFRDNTILWWEALILLGTYVTYVSFMKFNAQIERRVKKMLNRNKVTRVGSTDHLMPHGAKRRQSTITELRQLRRLQDVLGSQQGVNAPQAVTTLAPMPPGSSEANDEDDDGGARSPGGTPLRRRRMSVPTIHGGSKFRHGLLQLLIHSIDPLHEHQAKVDEKASQLHTIASLRVLLEATKASEEGVGAPNGVAGSTAGIPRTPASTTSSQRRPKFDDRDLESPSGAAATSTGSGGGIVIRAQPNIDSGADESSSTVNEASSNHLPDSGYNSAVVAAHLNREETIEEAIEEAVEEANEPLSVAWPDTWRERLNYVVLAPIIFPLWLTLPDVKRPEKRKFFPGSFLGSITWIAIFSYLMVWWATVTGETFGIPSEVMGLTFLAAGTSIPDLITSVLVARKGFGDMAVSSSVGSNIFDVAVGLPLPWFLSCLISGPVSVSSSGMACSIILLFLMLMFVIITIAAFNWKMNFGLAIVMFVLYFVFIACSLLLEYEVVRCNDLIGVFTGRH